MTATSPRHAWLFQVVDTKQLKKSTPLIDVWRIRRWASETAPGDLVFFWQSSEKGGLLGWGEVKEPPIRKAPWTWEVPVLQNFWLPSPVPRSVIREQGALYKSNLLLRNPNGTNFKIQPEEARRLAQFVPPDERPNVEALEPHSGGRDWVDDLLVKQEIAEITDLARNWIEEAVLLIEPKQDQRTLTTSRLFTAAFHLEDVERLPSDINDSYGIKAARHALSADSRLRTVIEVMKALYTGPSLRGAVPKLSANMQKLLVRAAQLSRRLSDVPDILTADGLLAALLTLDSGGVVRRIQSRNYSLADLRRSFLEAMNFVNPDRVWRWQQILNPGKADEPTLPPLDETARIAAVGNDDPWQVGITDRLGVRAEAQALARVAAAISFVPPLAIGVFGEWGSGKSYFLRLMYEHVMELQEIEADTSHKSFGSGDVFHRDIAQIRFNAWHYVETNLWASLVDHVFTELDRWTRKHEPGKADLLFEKLSTAPEPTLDAVEDLIEKRQEQRVAAAKLAAAEKALAAAREDVRLAPMDYLTAFSKTFNKQSIEVQAKLKAATNTLGFGAVDDQVQALQRNVEALGDASRRIRMIVAGLLGQFGPARAFLIVVILLGVPPLSILFGGWIATLLRSPKLAGVSSMLFGLSGVLSTLAGLAGVAMAHVRGAVDTLANFRAQIDATLAAHVTGERKAAQAAENRLAELTVAVDGARTEFTVSTGNAASAAQDYSTGTGKARLLRFIRDRAGNGIYAKHLGLAASVRRDFEELAFNMSQKDSISRTDTAQRRDAHQNRLNALIARANGGVGEGAVPIPGADASGVVGTAPPLLSEAEVAALRSSMRESADVNGVGLKRIILYVDDLDRCPPRVVAQVLQAVHLLLTFPLFVVVVAVDARWVRRSLRNEYPDLLDAADESVEGAHDGATANDYMEKIFQIPYWVRPMTAQASVEMLIDRIGPTAVAGKAVETVNSDSTNGSEPDAPSLGTEARLPDGVGTVTATVAGDGETNGDEPASGESPEDKRAAAAQALNVTEAEKTFMRSVAPYAASSPRRMLRFVNVYRVIKASFPPVERARLEQSGYRVLLVLIAMAAESTGFFRDILEALVDPMSQKPGTAASGLNTVFLKSGTDTRAQCLLQLLTDHPQRTVTGNSQVLLGEEAVAQFRDYAPIVRRYSFDG